MATKAMKAISENRSRRKGNSCRTRRKRLAIRPVVTICVLALLSSFAQCADDDYYGANDDAYAANNYYYDDQYQNNGGDDKYYADDQYADDQYAAGDDDDAAGDDAAAAAYDDQYYADAGDDYYTDDDNGGGGGGDDDYVKAQENYQLSDDDLFHWNSNVGFDGVSVMPLSCINYNSGHMIKFQLFDSEKSYQCHFAEISTFVVSISHYMRAYFNYQALTQGTDFQLPADAAYLNCNPLQGVDGVSGLYAKIGCKERETFTSTKLQLILYTDQQCSVPYDDGQTARKHASKGYDLNGELVSSKVSFNPEFYSCLSCSPEQIAYTFNKRNSNWYDDDYISEHGNKNGNNGNNQDDAVDDLYYAKSDDDNVNNDDGGGDDGGGDDDGYWKYNSYNANNGNRRQLELSSSESNKGVIQAYQDAFWSEYYEIQRRLYENDYYDIGEWNMCQRIYKYGVWCDEECRSLDLFRTDMWSASDIFLLSIMCAFMTAMMLLVVAKRLKAQQKARMYGEEHSMPGLPPSAMFIIFFVIMAVIITMAKLKFINETLVFAVVTCILLFIYMLKLTLFENRRPVLLAAPRHDMFDNPLDDHLFE